jgi:hypothetical protein
MEYIEEATSVALAIKEKIRSRNMIGCKNNRQLKA